MCAQSCSNGIQDNRHKYKDDLSEMLNAFDRRLVGSRHVTKEDFSSLVRRYKILEDSIVTAALHSSDSGPYGAQSIACYSVLQSGIVSRLHSLADSLEWHYSDIPVFQRTIYSYSPFALTIYHRQAVEFYSKLPPASPVSKSWVDIVKDYNIFLSESQKADIYDVGSFLAFLKEENDYFTMLVSNCRYAVTDDLSSIINRTEAIMHKYSCTLAESGTDPSFIRSFLVVRTNRRLIQNSQYALDTLLKDENISGFGYDLCISLLLSPFMYVNRELVVARTEDQISELVRIGRKIPDIISRNCSHSEREGIYTKDIPLLIIKRIITEDYI